jgi:hypothetical protein
LAIGQESLLAGKVVHLAAAHGDQKLRDVPVDAGAAQCRDAARSEREVDRPAAERCRAGETRTALDDDGYHAAPRQQDREQAARRPAADDRDALAVALAHASNVRRRACTAPKTSR